MRTGPEVVREIFLLSPLSGGRIAWSGMMVPREKQLVEIDCREVWKEITNYIEGDVTQEIRERVDRHLRECPHCKAVYDGSQNVVRLLGGKGVLELPTGFSQRLHLRLSAELALIDYKRD
jgi:anti-sigma factor (TIGR02949 family)